MSGELAGWLMLLLPYAGAALVPLLNFLSSRLVPYFAVLVGLASSVVAFFVLGASNTAGTSLNWLPGVLKTGLSLDALSVVPALIATWIGFLVLIYSLGYMKGEENLSRYFSLTLLFIGSMVGMSLADNFLALFFFWEVMGVCSYALIGFFYKDPKAAAAGVKAFLTTKIGDVGLLTAILLLYANTGTFAIGSNLEMAASLGAPILGMVSFGFIMGAVGKSAQLPLHVWLPDAMEAPTTISALIHAATMVNAGVYLLARVSPLLAQAPWSLMLVQWIGALTALLGSLLATFNFDLKRILAYSTVSQLGYMVMAVGLGAVFASQFHLFSHAIFKALLFLGAGAVIHAIGTRDIRQMGGLNKVMPIVGATFFVGALALMGFPMLNGFFSKDLILESALVEAQWGPLIVAGLAALLTAFYALRTTATVFWGKARYKAHPHRTPWVMSSPLVLLALATFVSWLLVGLLTAAWNAANLAAPELTIPALLLETFTAPAFFITLGVIFGGLLLFVYRKPIGKGVRERVPGLLRATSAGLGFDAVYGGLSRLVYAAGGFVLAIWDEKVMEGINRLTGWCSVRLSEGSRVLQTGDIHWNLLYIVLTLIILLGFVLW
jgi:NADH-quinone oxidoreductase subunit L